MLYESTFFRERQGGSIMRTTIGSLSRGFSTWSEQYDPTVFAMDGSVTFTFDGNNGYQLHVYDALSGESHDYSGHYAIDLINKGTITINPAMSGFSNVTYKLVKLTSKEMEWQKEGTTYSVGTWGADYRHFVREK